MPFLFYSMALGLLYFIVNHPDLAFTLWMLFILRFVYRIFA